MENRQLNFDVSRGGIQHRLFVRVGDARSRTVTARMYSGSDTVPITAAYLRAMRADGTQIYSPCTVQDGEVVYTFATEDLACGGELQCEFDLHNGESVMTSPRFIVVCEKLLYTGEGIETSDEYQAYIAALLKLENLTVDAVKGDQAAVAKEVTDTGIVLHFTLPKGDKGEQGPQGIQGETGAQGPQGAQGDKGEAPRIGDNGNWYVYDNATQKWVDTGVRAGDSADFAESDNTAPAYIRNRPFGVVEGVLAEQALHFTAAGDTYSCDAVTSAALVLGEKYRIIWDGMEYFCTAESNISGGGITITGNYLGNPAQFLTSGDMGDTGEPFFIAGNAGVAGISVFSTDGDTDHTIRIERVKPLHTGWLSETVVSKEYVQKELDAANTAIDALQTAVADLQYQKDETEETDILPQQELAFVVDDDSLYLGTAPAISLIAGEQYIVVWDGVEYETTAVMYEAFGGNGIGNASLLDLGDDTGEPFAIGVIGETTYLSTPSTETAHTVRIYQLIVGSNDLPVVTEDDNDKILQVVGGKYTLVFVEDSVVKNYIDGYINDALGGEY